MKTPLRYQITEFDCGSVSLLNCITFLFEREEIPAELVKAISSYTLDCYDEFGNLGQNGTSREAVQYLSKWICDFSNLKDLGVSAKYLNGEDITLEKITKCIKSGGCVNLRTYQECDHYVVITNIDNELVYMWDPYYLEADVYANNKMIENILTEPFKYNRKVKIKHFLSNSKTDFSLGPVQKREAVLITRTKTK